MSLTTNLKSPSNANGVSGDESAVRKIVIDLIRDYVDDLRVDTIGNILAVKRARGAAKLRVMLDAHMDEIGFMIFGANGDGSLKFRAVGGIDVRILPGKAVLVGPDRISGVIGVKPIHLLKTSERQQVMDAESMTIDIGAKSKEEAQAAVKLGDYATFATEFAEMGNGLLKGKALDDRTGCATVVEILKRDYPDCASRTPLTAAP